MKKNHEDRMAFIDHLEKKYIRKVRLHELQRQKQQLKQTLRRMRGGYLGDTSEQTMDILTNKHRIAY